MKPLTPTTPHVIIMVGIPGAGKTAFAEHFAKTFQAPIINKSTIQQAAGLSESAVETVTYLMLDELLKTQRTLIYDGPTDTKVSRATISKYVVAAGYRPLIVWVQTESLEAQRRATRRQKDTNSLTAEEFASAIKRFNPPAETEQAVVISGKHTYASQLKIVLKRLAGEQRSGLAPDTTPPRPRPGRTVLIR